MFYSDENLGTYWECLLGQQQKRDFTKEAYGRQNLNMKFMDDESYEDMRTTCFSISDHSNLYYISADPVVKQEDWEEKDKEN